jgi:hypothetical protein
MLSFAQDIMESSGNPLSSGHLIWKNIKGEKNNFATSNSVVE